MVSPAADWDCPGPSDRQSFPYSHPPHPPPPPPPAIPETTGLGEPTTKTPWGQASPPSTPDQRHAPEAEDRQPPARHRGGGAGWAPVGMPGDSGQEGRATCAAGTLLQSASPAKGEPRCSGLASLPPAPTNKYLHGAVELPCSAACVAMVPQGWEHLGLPATIVTPWHVGATRPCSGSLQEEDS